MCHDIMRQHFYEQHCEYNYIYRINYTKGCKILDANDFAEWVIEKYEKDEFVYNELYPLVCEKLNQTRLYFVFNYNELSLHDIIYYDPFSRESVLIIEELFKVSIDKFERDREKYMKKVVFGYGKDKN